MKKKEENDNKEKITFVYEVISKKFERQNDAFNGIIGKASYLFAFVSTFFAIYIGTVFQEGLNIWWNIMPLLLTVAVLFYLIQVIKIRTFKDPPKIDEFYNDATLAKELTKLKNITTSTIIKAYKINQETIDEMANSFNKSLWLLFATFVIIILLNTIAYVRQQNKSTTQKTTTTTVQAAPSEILRVASTSGQYR